MSAELRPSKKQRELLSFIQNFINAHGYGPSYREIMNGVGYRSVSTVAVHVDNLIKKGHLVKRNYSARSLEVVDSKQGFSEPKPASKSQEKWLVDTISAKFDDLKDTPDQKNVDDLYVLVGALQVLGFEDAARAFKSRLIDLKKST